MQELKRSVEQVVKGAFQAMGTFPAASISGLLFTITTMIRTQIEGVQADEFHLLFNSLHWAFAFGAIFGLMAATYVRGQQLETTRMSLANGVTGIVSLSSFLLLYFFGQTAPDANSSFNYLYLSEIANARMAMLLGVTFLAFVLFAARQKENQSLSRTIFMIQKSFFIALIYGIVLLAGTSSVAGAIQGLLYPAMSFKVYQHLGSIIGFVTFLIFLGSLPDFSQTQPDEKHQAAQEQSKFIQLLFSYILVPVTLALTIVLLLWTIRIIFQGVGNSFIRLSSIATSYAVVGIWLYMMVHEAQNKVAKLYRQVFPFATLIILAFEGWALIQQLMTYGMQTTEYYFMLVWLVAVVAMLLLVFKNRSAYASVLLLVMATMLFSVMPLVGYQSLPVRLQVQRFEKLLIQAQMFENNEIIPGSEAIEQPIREKMTVSAQYLARQEQNRIPVWFSIEPYDDESFKEVMGFAPIYPRQEDVPPLQNAITSVSRENQAIAIASFDWRVPLTYQDQKEGQGGTFEGNKGTYEIEWILSEKGNSVPKLTIKLNNQVILNESLKTFVEGLLAEYPPTTEQKESTTVATLEYPFSTDEIEGQLIFNHIEMQVDENNQPITYWIEIEGVYMREK